MPDQTTKLENRVKDSAQLKINLKLYVRFWKNLFNKQVLLFISYGLFLVLMGAIMPVFTYLWKVYLDKAIGGNVSGIGMTLLLFTALRVLMDLCYFFSMQFMNYINFSSWRHMDSKINKKAISIKPEYFEIPHIQSLINRAWDFSHGDYIDMYQLGMSLIQQITQFIGVFASLYIISPLVAFVSLTNIIPALVSKLVKDKIDYESRRVLDDDKNELKYYENAIMNQSIIKDIIMSNSFSFFYRKYVKKADAIFETQNRADIKKAYLSFIESFISNSVVLMCILCAAVQMMNGTITLGGISAITTMIFRNLSVLTNIVRNSAFAFTATYGIQEYYKFMDLDIDAAEKKDGQIVTSADKDIIFKNVSYRYPQTKKYVVHNLNLTIKRGQHVVVAGANGSGKTTFVKLLMKLVEPSEGEIDLGDTDLKSMDDKEYWNLFSVSFQDYNKFKDSLRYNVGISATEDMRLDEKMLQTLSKAEFNKPVSLDEILTPEFGGISLSGGEWQKISIARTLFKDNNSIYIFDEPTASIDPVAESNLYKTLHQFTKENTSIFVTHRLGAAVDADLVLFFDNGRLAEYGSHTSLIARDGAYARFWKAQCDMYYA